MKLKRGSFRFKSLSISLVIGITFAIISVLANNYFIKKAVFRITEESAYSTLNYIEQLLKIENKELKDLGLIALLNREEIRYISLYDENGGLISSIGNSDSIAIKTLPNQESSFQKTDDGHYNFIKKVSGIKLSSNVSTGYIVLSLDLRYVTNLTGPINQFRILFFSLMILLLIVFVYYIAKNLTMPFEKAIIILQEMSKKGTTDINIDKGNYDEIKEILFNFADILSSLNSARYDLLSSEERLKTLLEKTGDIILVMDENFRIEYASTTFQQMTGIDVTKLDRRLPFSEFIPSEEKRRLLPFVRKVLRGNSTQDYELRLKGKDGSEIYLLTSWIIREGSDKEGSGIILFGKDITRHKEIEEILRKRTEALETILFSLSHDLKSPIFTLKGMTTLFRQQFYNSLNMQGQHFIDRISENIVKLERMISNMLDIVRFERQVFKMEEVNLNELIRYLRADMKDYIRECEAEVRLINELPVIKGDKDKIYIVFKNLLENALKYRSNKRKCQITIEAIANDKTVELIFEDNGSGIESRYLDRLFKPFSRAVVPSEDAPHGYGIGLAIVKGILDAHNTKIKVESSYGEWTRFRIFFDKSLINGW